MRFPTDEFIVDLGRVGPGVTLAIAAIYNDNKREIWHSHKAHCSSPNCVLPVLQLCGLNSKCFDIDFTYVNCETIMSLTNLLIRIDSAISLWLLLSTVLVFCVARKVCTINPLSIQRKSDTR